MTGIHTELVGGGTATASFHRSSLHAPWTLRSLNYTFNNPEPVPEPATMLLFGTGVARIAAKVYRLRRVKNRT